MPETFLKELATSQTLQCIVGEAGFVIGCSLQILSSSGRKNPSTDKEEVLFEPNAWIRISRDNTVTVIVGHSEMGQGVLTALSQVVAEELEADWHTVKAETAPASRVYKNPVMGSQMTAGSTSISSSWQALRKAAAHTRQMLVTAAALKWGVPVAECHASGGSVLHLPTERKVTYGELVGEVANLSRVPVPQLKSQESFTIVGKRVSRLDTPEKTCGLAVFGIDVQIPDLLVATVIHAPMIGGTLKSFDPSPALSLPGVLHVLPIPRGLAVVADSFWQALLGAKAIKASWDQKTALELSSEDLWEHWKSLGERRGRILRNEGNALREISRAHTIIEAAYELPFQAHACAEPMNCTAYVQPHRCDVWAPTQTQGMAQFTAARIARLPVSKVHVHTTFMGGAFGRRGPDLVAEAVTISKAIGKPVKVLWTREEDMRNDFFRPASYHLMKACLNKKGLPLAWFHRIVGPPTFERFLEEAIPAVFPDWMPKSLRSALARPGSIFIKNFITPKLSGEGAAGITYSLDNVRVEYIRDDPGIPVGPWRAVDVSTNTFAVESFLDELANAGGYDPLDLRLELLRDSPELSRVLATAADRAGWGTPSPEGLSRGLSVHDFHGTAVATVAEVSVEQSGRIRVHRVVCAVDCGIVVNPGIVEAQIAGGIAFGLTATLKSQVTIRYGRVEQTNLNSFPVLRMDEMPKVQVIMVPSSRPPSGIGEVSVPGIAPAVTNAIFAGTGRRVRRLPLHTYSAG